jgi:hypothetical protein
MHRLLKFGFPLILLLFEWGLRKASAVDASGFVGPTLAAAALATLVPLTELKKIPVKIRGHAEAVAIPRADEAFVYFVWVVLLVGLFVWLLTCQMSLKASGSWLGFPAHYWVGSVTYLVSVVLSVVKEKL